MPKTWEPAEEAYYLRLLKEGRKNGDFGMRPRSTFFPTCVAKMMPRYPHTTLHRLNSKRAYWKHKYGLFSRLYMKTGYSYEEETGWFHADWDDLAKGPLAGCSWFRKNAMPYKNDLEEIFGNSRATGGIAREPEAPAPDECSVTESQRKVDDLMKTIEDWREQVPDLTQMGSTRSSTEPFSSSVTPPPPRQRAIKPSESEMMRLVCVFLLHMATKSLAEHRTVTSLIYYKVKEQETKDASQANMTLQMRAIRCLQDVYRSQFSTEEMLRAIKVVSERYDVFMALNPDIQKRWLEILIKADNNILILSDKAVCNSFRIS